MRADRVSPLLDRVIAALKKNKFAMVVLLAGLALMLIPGRSSAGGNQPEQEVRQEAEFSLEEQEGRIASALSKIEGAGRVEVVLTVRASPERVLAQDLSESSSDGKGASESSRERDTKTVVVSSGSSRQEPVTLKYVYPEYVGALVVCEGAENAAVKYEIVRAVSGLTGLGADKIVVAKMNKS